MYGIEGCCLYLVKKNPPKSSVVPQTESSPWTPTNFKQIYMSSFSKRIVPEPPIPCLSWPTPIIPTPAAIDREERDYLPLILDSKVYELCQPTPLTYASKLSQKLESTIHLKREDLHSIFSFKCRGAYNKLAHLTEAERAIGVACVSAGTQPRR
jgi:hypothetical protein